MGTQDLRETAATENCKIKNASNPAHAYYTNNVSCRGHALRVFDPLVFVARRAALSAKVLFLFLQLPALGWSSICGADWIFGPPGTYLPSTCSATPPCCSRYDL